MEHNKKYKAIIIGLIIVAGLIIHQNITFKREIEYLHNRISSMESNINQGIYDLSHRISNEVEDLLNEQQNSYDYSIKNDYENRLDRLHSGTSTNKESTNYSFAIRNKTFGEDSFRIKSVVVKTFYEDNEVDSRDVTAHNIINSEAVQKLNLMIAAGDLDAKSIPEIEYGQMSIDDKGNEYGNYLVNIVHSETGASVEHNNYPTYTFKVVITYNNGDVFEY